MRTRTERGPRAVTRDVHYDACDNPSCPCFREGRGLPQIDPHLELVYHKKAPSLWDQLSDRDKTCPHGLHFNGYYCDECMSAGQEGGEIDE